MAERDPASADRAATGESGLDDLAELLAGNRTTAPAFHQPAGAGHPSGSRISLDLEREHRKGVPEIILADRKQPDVVLEAARQFVEHAGRAILSRVAPPLLEVLRDSFVTSLIDEYPAAGMAVVTRPDFVRPITGGQVGVLAAGASDVPVAEQAVVLAREMGCEVQVAYDVGVAGLHRLAEPMRRLRAVGVDAVVVAAGMDGALPSVVAGLVDVPVIGLPTSVGYGAGGRGLAALLSMLQTCSPGLVVVNIDNGIGAGASAALIANRMAAARRSVRPETASERP